MPSACLTGVRLSLPDTQGVSIAIRCGSESVISPPMLAASIHAFSVEVACGEPLPELIHQPLVTRVALLKFGGGTLLLGLKK